MVYFWLGIVFFSTKAGLLHFWLRIQSKGEGDCLKWNIFRSFLVSWFLGFLISWCLGFFVSQLQKSISCFVETCWCHITKNAHVFLKILIPPYQDCNLCFWRDIHSEFKSFKTFRVFLKISIPYSRFSRKFETDLHDLSVPAFSDIFKTFDFYNFKNSPKRIWDFLGLIEVSWRLQR